MITAVIVMLALVVVVFALAGARRKGGRPE
jgi:hypothetical protein